jgi:hypothetical protein
MKKEIIYGGVVAAILIGAFIYITRKKKQEDNLLPSPPPQPTPSQGFQKYKVTTLVTPLNVRSSPSSSASKINSLPKGSVIFAKPSSTSGWHIYSSNGSSESGYISSDYITKI